MSFRTGIRNLISNTLTVTNPSGPTAEIEDDSGGGIQEITSSTLTVNNPTGPVVNIEDPETPFRYVRLEFDPGAVSGGFLDGTSFAADYSGGAGYGAGLRTNDRNGNPEAHNPAISFVGAHFSLDLTKPVGTQLKITQPGLYVVQYSAGDPGVGVVGPWNFVLSGIQGARLAHVLTIDNRALTFADPVSCEDTLPVFPGATAGFIAAPANVPLFFMQHSGFTLATAYLDITIMRLMNLS